jgi:DNA-binding FrmR family transcriptional regulator
MIRPNRPYRGAASRCSENGRRERANVSLIITQISAVREAVAMLGVALLEG